MKNFKLIAITLSLTTAFVFSGGISNFSIVKASASSCSEGQNKCTSPLPQYISQSKWVQNKKHVKLSTGIDMKYIEMGNKNGKPIIFVHGFGDSSRSWSMITSYFTNNYHIYILDNRGFGDTDKPDYRNYPVTLYGTDIAAFMDAKNINSADIVGHSLGSFIAQGFAINYPEKTNHLVLESTEVLTPDPVLTSIYDMTLDFTNEYPDDEFIESWCSSINPVDPEFLEYEKIETKQVPVYVWKAAAKGLSSADFSHFMNEITVPTLVLWGSEDNFFNADTQSPLKTALPNAEFITFQGIGHNIHWEQPESFSNTVLQFLEK